MGNHLFDQVAALTGLPKHLISEELVSILGRVGSNPNAVTIEELRHAMASYLTEVIGPCLSEESSNSDSVDTVE